MYISIDVGGTNTRLVASNEIAEPTFTEEPLRRRNTHNFENDLSFIISSVLQLADGQPIDALGIGTPGSPNEDKTQIASAKNIPSWVSQPFVASLSGSLGCPVYYDNDVIAASLGEAHYGQTQGNFDYIIWGTGIGGGAVRRDEQSVNVSVLGWKTHFATWEHDNGGAELTKKFGKSPEDFTEQEWKLIADSFEIHLTNYIDEHKPKAIIFGGGLAVRHAQMLHDAGERLGVPISATRFGGDGGLMGGFGLIQRGLAAAEC